MVVHVNGPFEYNLYNVIELFYNQTLDKVFNYNENY